MKKSQKLNIAKYLFVIALKIITPLSALTIVGVIIDRKANSNHLFTFMAIIISLPITYLTISKTHKKLVEKE